MLLKLLPLLAGLHTWNANAVGVYPSLGRVACRVAPAPWGGLCPFAARVHVLVPVLFRAPCLYRLHPRRARPCNVLANANVVFYHSPFLNWR